MAELQADLRQAFADIELDELEGEGLRASYKGLPPKADVTSSAFRTPFTFGWTGDTGPSNRMGPMARDGVVEDPRYYTIYRCLLAGFIASDESNLPVLEAETAEKWMDLYLKTLLAHRNLGRDDCTIVAVYQSPTRSMLYGKEFYGVNNRIVIDADDDVEVGN